MERSLKTDFLLAITTLVVIKVVHSHDLSGYTKCPNTEDGWVLGPGDIDCYHLTDKKYTWPEARDFCASKGATLATINNVNENNLIKSFYNVITYGALPKPWGIWIGLYYKDLPLRAPLGNGFRWVKDDSRPSYTNWARWEPNNYAGWGETVVDLWEDGTWNDDSRWRKWYSVCQKKNEPYTPTPCDQSNPNDGWIRRPNENKVCYYPITDAKNKNSAQVSCESKGGSLVSITSKEEEDFLSLIGKKLLKIKSFWIGLQNYEENLWSDYKSMTGYSKVKKCYVFDPKTSDWNKEDCGTAHVSVCKKSILETPVLRDCQIHANLGYKQGPNNEYCFAVSTAKLPWSVAKDYCDLNHGVLASIENKEQNDLILKLTNNNVDSLWLGLSYNSGDQKFAWVDKKPVNYTNWRSHPSPLFNEPNGRSKNPEENCGKLLGRANGERAGSWIDDDCDEDAYGVCKLVLPFNGPNGYKPCHANDPHDGWVKIPNVDKFCFYIVKEKLSQDDSEKFCAEHDANLATIESRGENSFVAGLVDAHDADQYWIGLKRDNIGRRYWTDGNPTSFVHHYYVSPNNAIPCTAILPKTDFHFWTPLACSEKHYGICKRRIIPYIDCDQSNPNDGWIRRPYEDKTCYYPITDAKDKNSAEVSCKAKGGSLLLISSKEEEKFLSLIGKTLLNNKPIWIGLQNHVDLNSVTNYTKVEKCNVFDPKTLNWITEDCSKDHVSICKRTNLDTPVLQDCEQHANLGYKKGPNNKYCFKVTNNETTWLAAKDYCANNHGVLASIENAEENNFVLKLTNNRIQSVWLGLSYNSINEKFTWIDQNPVDYTNWRSHPSPLFNEPNGQNKNPMENCGKLLGRGNGVGAGSWKDDDCNGQAYGVCKLVLPYNGPSRLTPCHANKPNDGWVKSPDNVFCYYVVKEKLSRDDSEKICAENNAHLTSLQDEAENTFVAGLKDLHDADQFWIGLEKNVDGTDFWTDGIPSGYYNWPPGYSPISSKQCTAVSAKTSDKDWLPLACSSKQSGVCKKRIKPYTGPRGYLPCDNDSPNDGWVLGQDGTKCYHVTSKRFKWNKADEFCKSFSGANLASIENQDENTFVASLAKGYNFTDDLWLGLGDDGKNQWTDGESLSYNNFDSKTLAVTVDSPPCVTILGSSKTWAAEPCDIHTTYGVCKKTA